MSLPEEVYELLDKAINEKATCQHCKQLPVFICRAPNIWELLCEKHATRFALGYGHGLGYRVRNLLTHIDIPITSLHRASKFR